jgi:ATP-dependent Lon protease
VDVTVYREQRLHELELFLPATQTTKSLLRNLKDKAHEAHAQLEAKALEQVEVSTVTPAAKKTRASNRGEIESGTERDEMRARAQEDEIHLSETHRRVYEWDAPLSLIENHRTPDQDAQKRDKDIFELLKKHGHMRRVARPDSDLVFDALALLRERQPHFSAVVDLVRQHLRLAFAQGKPLHLPPILLLGEPGVGKTHLTKQLAAALQTPMRRHGFDSATTGSTLTGSERHWGNTSYGLMFELLCLNEIINPVVLLDEIDKASGAPHRNPAAPLHTLLEPVSAGQSTDLSVGLTFDASFVTWIATANDASCIPASLRSRFIEFLILPPLGQHALQVARNIATSVFEEMNLQGIEPVPLSITKLLAHLTAREQIQLLKRAYASAFEKNITCIELNDFPNEIFSVDAEGDDDVDNDVDIGKSKILH